MSFIGDCSSIVLRYNGKEEFCKGLTNQNVLIIFFVENHISNKLLACINKIIEKESIMNKKVRIFVPYYIRIFKRSVRYYFKLNHIQVDI